MATPSNGYSSSSWYSYSSQNSTSSFPQTSTSSSTSGSQLGLDTMNFEHMGYEDIWSLLLSDFEHLPTPLRSLNTINFRSWAPAQMIEFFSMFSKCLEKNKLLESTKTIDYSNFTLHDFRRFFLNNNDYVSCISLHGVTADLFLGALTLDNRDLPADQRIIKKLRFETLSNTWTGRQLEWLIKLIEPVGSDPISPVFVKFLFKNIDKLGMEVRRQYVENFREDEIAVINFDELTPEAIDVLLTSLNDLQVRYYLNRDTVSNNWGKINLYSKSYLMGLGFQPPFASATVGTSPFTFPSTSSGTSAYPSSSARMDFGQNTPSFPSFSSTSFGASAASVHPSSSSTDSKFPSGRIETDIIPLFHQKKLSDLNLNNYFPAEVKQFLERIVAKNIPETVTNALPDGFLSNYNMDATHAQHLMNLYKNENHRRFIYALNFENLAIDLVLHCRSEIFSPFQLSKLSREKYWYIFTGSNLDRNYFLHFFTKSLGGLDPTLYGLVEQRETEWLKPFRDRWASSSTTSSTYSSGTSATSGYPSSSSRMGSGFTSGRPAPHIEYIQALLREENGLRRLNLDDFSKQQTNEILKMIPFDKFEDSFLENLTRNINKIDPETLEKLFPIKNKFCCVAILNLSKEQLMQCRSEYFTRFQIMAGISSILNRCSTTNEFVDFFTTRKGELDPLFNQYLRYDHENELEKYLNRHMPEGLEAVFKRVKASRMASATGEAASSTGNRPTGSTTSGTSTTWGVPGGSTSTSSSSSSSSGTSAPKGPHIDYVDSLFGRYNQLKIAERDPRNPLTGDFIFTGLQVTQMLNRIHLTRPHSLQYISQDDLLLRITEIQDDDLIKTLFNTALNLNFKPNDKVIQILTGLPGNILIHIPLDMMLENIHKVFSDTTLFKKIFCSVLSLDRYNNTDVEKILLNPILPVGYFDYSYIPAEIDMIFERNFAKASYEVWTKIFFHRPALASKYNDYRSRTSTPSGTSADWSVPSASTSSNSTSGGSTENRHILHAKFLKRNSYLHLVDLDRLTEIEVTQVLNELKDHPAFDTIPAERILPYIKGVRDASLICKLFNTILSFDKPSQNINKILEDLPVDILKYISPNMMFKHIAGVKPTLLGKVFSSVLNLNNFEGIPVETILNGIPRDHLHHIPLDILLENIKKIIRPDVFAKLFESVLNLDGIDNTEKFNKIFEKLSERDFSFFPIELLKRNFQRIPRRFWKKLSLHKDKAQLHAYGYTETAPSPGSTSWGVPGGNPSWGMPKWHTPSGATGESSNPNGWGSSASSSSGASSSSSSGTPSSSSHNYDRGDEKAEFKNYSDAARNKDLKDKDFAKRANPTQWSTVLSKAVEALSPNSGAKDFPEAINKLKDLIRSSSTPERILDVFVTGPVTKENVNSAFRAAGRLLHANNNLYLQQNPELASEFNALFNVVTEARDYVANK